MNPTLLVRRVLPVLMLGVMLVLALRLNRLPGAVGDLWFHLRLGDEFRGGWSVGDPGHLGVFDNAEWTPTQWLPQVALSWVEDVGGLAAVLWVTGVVMMLVLVAVYLAARLEVAPLPAALATILCFLGLASGLSARPQLLSYLLVVVVVAAWRATARDGRPRYWLLLVAWLWAPVHGMWPLAIVVAVVVIAGMALDRRTSRAVLQRLLLIPLGSAVLVLATPVGWDIYTSVLTVGSRSRYFSEWQSPDFTDVLTAGVSATVALVLVGMLRREGPVAWVDVLLLGSAIVAALYSQRTLPVAAVILAPLAADVLQAMVPRSDGLGRRELAAVAALVTAAAAGFLFVLPERADVRAAPAWLDEALAAQGEGTRVLDDWDVGPYFLWRHPHLDLVMHGYGDVFTDAELARNADISLTEPGWQGQVRDLDAELAVVRPDTRLEHGLTHEAGWEVIEADGDFVLLAPPAG